tara:strand:+ start:287 stop:979 length:693 start_codon:yes stop_codon:yes gene_type:complete
MKTAIIYKRVSTKKETQTLSLETQHQELTAWAQRDGLEVIGTFQDRCSGKQMGDCRKGLQEAIQLANDTGAVILITELSRLSRSVRDIADLIANDTKFIITRSGRQISKVELLLLAVFAEAESDSTSRRVKASIQAKFDRDPESRSSWGRGTDPSSPKDMERGRIAKADAYALKTGVSAYHLREQGMTFQSIAEIYQAQGHKTSRGKNTWNTTQVRQLILRYTRLIQEAS